MDGQNKGVLLAAALGLPLVLILMVMMIFVVEEDDAATSCDTGTTGTSVPAAYINPASVPAGPVAGYSGERLVNAAYVMKAAADLGLSLRDQQIGVMTAMGESGLRVLDYGDGAGPDSRGLFQQRDNGAWGSYADRMDPYISATSFFKVLATLADRNTLEPTIAAHRVQRNADPYHYTRYWTSAVQVVSAVAGGPNTSIDQASTDESGAYSNASLGCAASASYGDGSWARPIPGAPVTSGYGPRSAPVAGASSFHKGTDYGGPCGTQFHAIGSGLVIAAGPASGYGHSIRVDHGGGVISEYGHMYANGILTRVGDRVTTGQAIGLVGSDGYSSGCHLHLTIHVDGKTVDPEKFFASAPAGVQPVSAQQGGSTSGGSLVAATFNALGSSHTDGIHPERAGWADSIARTRAMVRMFNNAGLGVVGLQEFQPRQQDAFESATAGTWQGWGIKDNWVVWRTDQFKLLGTDQLAIPYFNGNIRQMPAVRLEHRGTGRQFVVLSIHNPADVHGDAARWRAEAIKRERAYVRTVQAGGTPVLLTGDFNDRDVAFCGVTDGNLMTSPAGGSNVGDCRPPASPAIDWIFGHGFAWQAFAIDHSPRGSISDHPLVATRARFN